MKRLICATIVAGWLLGGTAARAQPDEGAKLVARELMAKVKATLQEAAWQPDFDAAVTVELDRQAWSFARGYLNERVRRP